MQPTFQFSENFSTVPPDSPSIAHAIDWLIDFYDLTQTELANRLNMSNSRISQIANGQGASLRFLKRLAEKFPRLNMDWALTGEGEPLKSTVMEGDLPGRIRLPIYDASPALFQEPFTHTPPDTYCALPAHLAPQPSQIRAVRLAGEWELLGTGWDTGTVAAVDISANTPETVSGKLACAVVEDHIMIRRVYEENGVWTLADPGQYHGAAPAAYPATRMIRDDDANWIAGKVIYAWVIPQ